MRSDVKKKGLKAVAKVAKGVTSYNENSSCWYYISQPKMPKNSEKLRKF